MIFIPVVNLIQPSYDELENLKNEMKNQKKQAGKPTKTTFSEIVCMLIKNYMKRV